MSTSYSFSRVAVVIDDERPSAALLTQALEQARFTVHLAGTGPSGLELVRRHSPVVTVMDVDRLGVDAFETAKSIRSVSETYLMLLAGRDAEADLLQGYECGADCVVPKPVRPLELRARIEAMLRRPRLLGP